MSECTPFPETSRLHFLEMNFVRVFEDGCLLASSGCDASQPQGAGWGGEEGLVGMTARPAKLAGYVWVQGQLERASAICTVIPTGATFAA